MNLTFEYEYNFIKLDESRITDLILLYKLCFGIKITFDELLSKQLNCNGENKFVGFIAYTKNNSPAAFYGVYPQLISYSKQEYLVAQSGDTMTHPDHQKKGLFIALAKHTFEYCKTIDILAIFGFPNQNSYPGFIHKLDFKELEQLTGFTFYENRLEFCRLFKSKLTSYNCLIIKFLKFFYKAGNSFENSNKNLSFAFVKHDDIYFNSKNKKNNLILKIKNIDVFIKLNGNTISIGDLNTDDTRKIISILSILKRICFVFGLRFLNFDATSNCFLYNKLSELNPRKFNSNRSILLSLVPNLPFDSIEFLGSDIDVF